MLKVIEISGKKATSGLNTNQTTADKLDMQKPDSVWFIYDLSYVHGPFTTQEMKDRIDEGLIRPQDLGWRRGQQGWRRVAELTDDMQNEAIIETWSEETLFYVEMKGLHRGPVYWDSLIRFIRLNRQKGLIKIWTEGLTEWLDYRRFPQIVQTLGIQRRNYSRVPLLANVELHQTHRAHESDAVDISQGGICLRNTPELEVGQEVSVKVSSPLLHPPLWASGRVVHRSQHGWGIRFEKISSQGLSSVVSYVKRFESNPLEIISDQNWPEE